MTSVLIVGGNLKKRKERTLRISNYELGISNIDTLILEGDNSIGIDKIRGLEQKISRKPYLSKFKSAIIPEAEKLTSQAQNALLKTLEEPPKNTLILLTAPKESFLLPTIVSRCKIIKLKTESEITLSDKEISQYLNISISLLNSGVGERIKKAESVAKTREETVLFLDQLIVLLRQILLKRVRFDSSPSIPSSPSPPSFSSPSQIVSLIRKASKTKKMVEKNVNFKLALENFFLDLPKIE